MGLLICLVCLPTATRAQDVAWETVLEGAVTLKSRNLKNSQVREFWAEGELAAPALDVQNALATSNRLKEFMPYLKDCREISEIQQDGSRYVQTLVDLPVIGKRDYVVKVWTRETIQADGTGTFRNEWTAEPDYLPRRTNVRRITLNNGGWTITPLGDGSRSWAVYKFAVDPGGWVPVFAVNIGNQSGVLETFQAITKEALKRKSERLKAQAQTIQDAQADADRAAKKTFVPLAK
jgi:Polyketide cyclase / dehydrase and lipid transport